MRVDPAYGLGLEPGINRLVDYSPLWPAAFAEEARLLAGVLGDAAIAIEHYGSTSVPGLRAKPIIDIQVGVDHIECGIAFIPLLGALGYDYAGDQGIPDHHIFGLGAARTHLVHVLVFNSDQWLRSLRFRDRLRADRSVRQAYENLKDRLAHSSRSRAEYTAGKTAFVVEHSAP